jgi:hypothetical protein
VLVPPDVSCDYWSMPKPRRPLGSDASVLVTRASVLALGLVSTILAACSGGACKDDRRSADCPAEPGTIVAHVEVQSACTRSPGDPDAGELRVWVEATGAEKWEVVDSRAALEGDSVVFVLAPDRYRLDAGGYWADADTGWRDCSCGYQTAGHESHYYFELSVGQDLELDVLVGCAVGTPD